VTFSACRVTLLNGDDTMMVEMVHDIADAALG
jgi:hypothetical protein